mgnify:FL=1|jgi:acylphosphatase|tara:strand:- start:430 stop:708 length:279 start_codon:yes stop_codon:yes gene_type:complete
MVKQRTHILVTGKVQGVFFRQATKVVAIKNNVNGWVKNLENSQVEILLEGEETDVNSVVDWCRNGPANSRVDKIEINQQIFVGELLNFEVLY